MCECGRDRGRGRGWSRETRFPAAPTTSRWLWDGQIHPALASGLLSEGGGEPLPRADGAEIGGKKGLGEGEDRCGHSLGSQFPWENLLGIQVTQGSADLF